MVQSTKKNWHDATLGHFTKRANTSAAKPIIQWKDRMEESFLLHKKEKHHQENQQLRGNPNCERYRHLHQRNDQELGTYLHARLVEYFPQLLSLGRLCGVLVYPSSWQPGDDSKHTKW